MDFDVKRCSAYGSLAALLVGVAVSACGCGASSDEACTELMNCGPFDGAEGAVAAMVPAGWDGFYVLRGASPDSNAAEPACADGSAAQRFFVEPKAKPSCTACTCTFDESPACGIPVLECSMDDVAWTTIKIGPPNVCVHPLEFAGQKSCRMSDQVEATGGAFHCDGGQVEAVNAPSTAQTIACKADERDLHAPSSLCVRRDGDEECPAGWGIRAQVYRGLDDRWECTSCECEDAGACAAGFMIHDADGCNKHNGSPPIFVTTEVVDVSLYNDYNTWSILQIQAIPPSTCIPKGGEPVEKNAAADTITFCCR